MGSILSRRIAGVEDIDIQANSAYRFPPKSGNYFASHFFMGGEKFDTPHPEGYLFGENMDLNFLGNRPVQFPYVTPAPHEPVKTLRSLVNIRKDSLRLVRYKDDADSPTEEEAKPKVLYGVEFTFDADARVAITLYCQAFEEFSNGMAAYNPKSPLLVSETVHYKRGVSQQFSMPSFKIDFSDWKEEDLNFDLDRGVFPMVIQAVVDEGDDCLGHAHVLLAAFERHVDGSFSVKPLKQKQIVGLFNHDVSDVWVLPAFRALLQIRAVRKKPGALSPVSFSPVLAQTMDHDEHSSSDSVPPGFEPISLLEALNGLRSISPANPSAPLYDDINFSGGGGESRALSSPEHLSDGGSLQKSKVSKSPDSSTLRSPSSPIQEEDEEKLSEMSDAQPNPLLSSSPAPTEASLHPMTLPLAGFEERPHSREEILEDCISEHSSLTKTESDPPGDLSLPGSSESTESLKSQSTNCSSQPLLSSPRNSFHLEDEHH
uniref:E3 ubiquitin-protein ligase n=1 Tax=Gadus morhua TaxID=8049 RepID=A0A8C5CUE6_GADMO